ncbi:MAG: MerR family transcriptional regulator [Clostridiales bacterium]|nr:MerR family transcriptional regulator [Clostridiales bacterium]
MTRKRSPYSIREFAKLTRTTRDSLIYYDKIGLLAPARRGDNNYRYYSSNQLAVLNLIHTFQELGLSLEEIKRLKDNRTPDLINVLLDNLITRIDQEIEKKVRARKLLHLLKTNIHSQLGIDETAITVRFRPAEAIVLGDINDYSRGRNDYDALFDFYKHCHENHPDYDMNYPVWGMFEEARIKNRDWVYPDRFYLYFPEGHDKKPAALYAIGYKRGAYGDTHDLYVRMLDYIETNGYEICGPAYEEYPLDEICVKDESDYLIRIMITVREKKGARGKNS